VSLQRRSSSPKPYGALVAAAAMILQGGLVVAPAGGQAPGEETVRPFLWQPEMAPSQLGEINVFRRFSSDRTPAMRAFYGDVLGLVPLPPSAPGGGQMIRYPIGASEVKLFPVAADEASSAAVADAVGVRLLTFFFADERALAARFEAHGGSAPKFTARGDGTRAALAQDPDGEWVELVVLADATAAELARFEIGLTVADLDASRAFYRDFVGLAESGPAYDALLGTQKYTYRHGATTINLWSFGRDLPADPETAGMQYIVWNVAGVDEVARRRGATIDRPLSAPGTMRTVWLDDPDGNSNYFAEYAEQDNTPPAASE
jgi:catechol 2,3-dioxygenase-like lactoylglutathione lyase family enzyme